MRNGYIKNVEIRIKDIIKDRAEKTYDEALDAVAEAFAKDFKTILKEELKDSLHGLVEFGVKTETFPSISKRKGIEKDEFCVMNYDIKIALDLDSEASAIVERGIIEVTEPIEEIQK